MAVGVIGCGGGGSDTSPPARPTTAPEVNDFVAEDLLLDGPDFPDTWVHRPWDQEAIDEFRSNPAWVDCYKTKLPGEIERAYGGEYSDANTTLLSVNPAIYIFDSAASAEAGVGHLIQEYECFAGVVGAGMDVDDKFALGEAQIEALPADDYSAESAIRVYNTQVYKTFDPPETDVLVFDVVYVVEGAVVAEVTGFQRHSPIDQALLATYVEKAHAKIR